MKNPSAFPSPGVVMTDGRQQGAYEGMTMRDYFAAAALQGMLAATPEAADYPSRIATSELAYLYADAMLKERERGE